MNDFNLILTELQKINNKITTLESNMNKQFEDIKEEIRVVKNQTAVNTEQEVMINSVKEKVSDLESDVKLIKKVITNQ